MLYMVTFTINIPQMLAYIPYMDPMGNWGPNSYPTYQPTHLASWSRCTMLADRERSHCTVLPKCPGGWEFHSLAYEKVTNY